MTPIQNPHAFQSSFTQGQPAALPVFPLAKPTSDAGREAKRLHDAATTATTRLQEVRDAAIDAASKLRAAQEALNAELIRGAREGLDAVKQQKLSLELSACERLADPQTAQIQFRAAVQAQRDAVRAYNVHVWDHFPELLKAELAAEAHSASAALVKALESIAPVRERYLKIQQRVWQLSQITIAGEYGQHWAQALAIAPEPQPPLPAPEAIEQFERARTPVQAIVEPDEHEEEPFVEGDEQEDEAVEYEAVA